MLAARCTNNNLAVPLNAFRKCVISGSIAGVHGNDDIGRNLRLIICDMVYAKGQLLPTQRFDFFLMAFDQIGININARNMCIEF